MYSVFQISSIYFTSVGMREKILVAKVDIFVVFNLVFLSKIRILSEYLGLETMLAIVCKNYEAVKELEKYDVEGTINCNDGLHGLGSSIGRKINGRFSVINLEDLRQIMNPCFSFIDEAEAIYL